MLAMRLFRSELGFAHVDLIPDGSRSWPFSSPEERTAFEVLRDAVARDAKSLPSSSVGAVGRHVELADPTLFEAVVVYGLTSINCEVYRHRDRAVLLDPLGPWVDPMVSTHDHVLTPLALEEDEAELFQEALRRHGLEVEVVRWRPFVRWARVRLFLGRFRVLKGFRNSERA